MNEEEYMVERCKYCQQKKMSKILLNRIDCAGRIVVKI